MTRLYFAACAALIGLGLGLLVAALKAPAKPKDLPRRAYRPIRALPRLLEVGAVAVASSPALLLAFLIGPLLAAAVGVLLISSMLLFLHTKREKFADQLRREARQLAGTLKMATGQGMAVEEALRLYVERQPGKCLAAEIKELILAPLDGSVPPVVVYSTLAAEANRYRGHFVMRRLCTQLARAAQTRQPPESTAQSLEMLLAVVDEAELGRQELAVATAQARFSRWAVAGIISGAVLFLALLWPQAREHWLNDLVGQGTLFFIALSISTALLAGEMAGQVEAIRF